MLTIQEIIQLSTMIIPVVTAIATWFAKGKWDERQRRVKSATEEVDNYHELIEKMQSIITNLNLQVLELKKENSEMKNSLETIKSYIEDLTEENSSLKNKIAGK